MAISDSARISPGAQLGHDVSVGDFTAIGTDVRIGDDCVIDSHCVLGYETHLADGPLVIGAGARIRSHSIFYRGSEFGPGLSTGHHVTVREGVMAGPGLQLGTQCDLQGDTRIGAHTRMHSSVHVGTESTIGSYVWIYPYVVLTNDRQPPSEGPYLGPTVDDYAVIATMSVILPGVHVGTHALVAAHALVRADVPDDTFVAGVPATPRGRTSEIMLADDPRTAAYPWPRRFRRGYPPDVVARWAEQWPESGLA